MADPVTVVGLIGSIISIIEGFNDTTEAINSIVDRPNAFRMVENDLPLINSILRRARSDMDRSGYDNEREQLARGTLQTCENKAAELRGIFIEIEMKCKEGNEVETQTWSKAREWYRTALKNQKAHRVENLMAAILEGLKKLAIDKIFDLHGDMGKMTNALEDLRNVEASLDDSEFDLTGPRQTVASGGKGIQNNAMGEHSRIFNQEFHGNTTNNWGWVHKLRFVCIKLYELEETKLSPGTCQWLFAKSEFQTWKDSTKTEKYRPILVLVGKAGSGKSVLIHQAFKHCSSDLLSRKHLNVKFFFNRKDKEGLERTITGFLRSFLSQLLEQLHPSIEAYSVLQTLHDLQGSQEFNDILLKQAISHVASLVPKDEIFVFLDALDECDGSAGSRLSVPLDLLDFLEGIVSGHRNIRFCVSTRSLRDFGFHQIRELSTFIDVTCHNQQDIELYLDEQLARIPTRDPGLVSKLKFIMSVRASHMFLWVRLVILKIHDCRESVCTETQILQDVSGYPEGLDNVYQTLLDRMDESQRQDAISLLKLIYVATRPITVSESISALGKTKEYHGPHAEDLFGNHLQNLSGGLVEVRIHRKSSSRNQVTQSPVPVTKTVRFIHQSVFDFLRDGKLAALMGSPPEEFEAYCHASVAKVCMRFINREIVMKTAKETEEQNMGFVPYASQFWTLHARNGDTAMDLEKDLQRAFSKCPMGLNRINSCFVAYSTRGNGPYLRIAREHYPDQTMLRHSQEIGSNDVASSDPDISEQSLLVLLAFEGCTKLVFLHKTHCKDKTKCCGNPNTLGRAFFLASYRGWIATVKLVHAIARENGVAININIIYQGETPLHAACRNGKIDVVEFLLNEKAKIMGPRSYPLHTAIFYANHAVVEAFLRHVSNDYDTMRQLLSCKNGQGKTPLHVAAECVHEDVFRELVEVIRDFRLGRLASEKSGLSDEGQTPLEIAGHQKSKVEEALAKGMEKYGKRVVEKLKHRKKVLGSAMDMLEALIIDCGNE